MRRKKDQQTQMADEAILDDNVTTGPGKEDSQPTREPGDEPVYPPAANPFEIASNNDANVRLLERRGAGKDDPYYRIIAFPDGKPSDKVRQYMKDEGVQWNNPRGSNSWNVIVNYPTRNQDRLHADRVYAKVVDMILEEKGLAREPEMERF